MRKDIDCCFHVKLYTEEEYREIIRKIKKQFNKKETITYKEIQNLQKEYKLGEKNIREIFEIPEKIKIEEITNLNISQNKYYKKEELTKQDKQKIKKEIMKYTKKKDEITLDELKIIKENTKYTDYEIKKALGINPEKYKQFIHQRTKILDIITYEEERKIYFLKLDLKLLYKYGEREYTKQEIDNICKEYKITKKKFIKYIIGTRKNYKLMNKAFNKNEENWYIGENKNASPQFIEKLYDESDKIIEYQAKNLIYTYNVRESYKELKQAAYLELIERGGKIEFNFSYDKQFAI